MDDDTKTVTINITIPFAGRLRREIIGAIREIQRTARLASDPSREAAAAAGRIRAQRCGPGGDLLPADSRDREIADLRAEIGRANGAIDDLNIEIEGWKHSYESALRQLAALGSAG